VNDHPPSMSHLMNKEPDKISILRFKSEEDGRKFLETGDESLSVPPFIERNGKCILNPEYDAAEFEIGTTLLYHKKAIKLLVPDKNP